MTLSKKELSNLIMDLLVSSVKITLSLTAIYSWIMDLSLTVTN